MRYSRTTVSKQLQFARQSIDDLEHQLASAREYENELLEELDEYSQCEICGSKDGVESDGDIVYCCDCDATVEYTGDHYIWTPAHFAGMLVNNTCTDIRMYEDDIREHAVSGEHQYIDGMFACKMIEVDNEKRLIVDLP